MNAQAEPATDRQVELGQTVQRTAAEVEQLAATLTQLRARIETIEAHVAGARAGQSDVSSRLETLVAEVGHYRRLDDAIRAARNEIAGVLEERSVTLRGEIARSQKEHERVTTAVVHRSELLDARVQRIEDQVGRDEASARLEVLRSELGRLARRLDTVESRTAEVEQRPPRVAPALSARVDSVESATDDLSRAFNDWQKRIEEQSETVRESRHVASAMRREAEQMREAHHAIAEAQRLFERRLDDLVAEVRDEFNERWDRFLTDRGHTWDALERANSVRDHEAGQHGARLTAIGEELAALGRKLDAGLEVRAAELGEMRQSVMKAFGALHGAAADATATVESGLPYEERSDVIEERQLAVRRALRAHRPSSMEG